MASSSSWFQRSPPSKQDYELPRWRTPSPLRASMIPPPIVQSAYKSSPKLSTILPTRSAIIDKPTSSESRETDLQADLQFLLDAQAEGLIRGLEGGTLDGVSSTGSTTPTGNTLSSVPRQINRPVRKKLGLRSARKGIYSCMIALATVKYDELTSADRSLQEKENTLAQIDGWEKKRQGLQDATFKVDGDEETIRVQRLRQESDVLQEEINKVEIHLMELKTKQRRLLKQAAALENTVQAKLSSYTTSINLLENDIKAFLNSKPAEDLSLSRINDGKQSVWQLPSNRRTLNLVKEQVNAEQDGVRAHLDNIRLEKDALDEGSRIWKDVVGRVTDFERRLRLEMASLNSITESTMAWDDTQQTTPADHLSELYEQMQALIVHLERQAELVESRNWRLLIAAIGAELDALQRGKTILDRISKQDPVTSEPDSNGSQDSDENGDQLRALDGQFEGHDRTRSSGQRSDTDDEPDPELLFSVQNTDD